MKTINPSHLVQHVVEDGTATKLSPDHLKWIQSTFKVLSGNISLGEPALQDATAGINKGVFTTFEKGNGSGVLIRVAANGVSGSGAAYNWTGVNVGIPINHGLQRQPVGFFICDKDKTVDVYRTAPPDATQITLAPTDNSASVTLYIF